MGGTERQGRERGRGRPRRLNKRQNGVLMTGNKWSMQAHSHTCLDKYHLLNMHTAPSSSDSYTENSQMGEGRIYIYIYIFIEVIELLDDGLGIK